ncbi:unnamed protein product, partial [Ectocarpus sp. 4 AP-2014]
MLEEQQRKQQSGFESGCRETQPALESNGRASALDQRTSCSTPSANPEAGIPDLRRARQSEALAAQGAAATPQHNNSLLALSSPNLHQRMFSSGSEASPRNDREYGRGTSSVTSTMDDAFESSGTAVKAGGPLMSPVLRTLASAGSGLAEGMMMPVEEVPILPDPAGDTGGLVVAALRAAGRGQQFVPLEPPDIEAPRSTAARAHHGRGRPKQQQQQQQHATGESDMIEASENAEGGAHLPGGLPLPVGSVGAGVPNGGVDGRRGSPQRKKKSSDIGGGGGGSSSGSGSSSSSPSRVRRRGRPLSEEPENDDASATGKGNKRRHAPPTPKHRVLSGAWGKLAAPERSAAAAANEEQGGKEEQGKDDCATSCGSRSSSEFTSESNKAGSSSDSPS